VDNIVLKDGEYEIILTEDYEGMLSRLKGAQEVANFATFAVQLYSSWIIYNALWADAANSFWSDMETGEVYADSLHASEDVRPRLRFRRERLFHTQSEFFVFLEEEVPQFKVSTFWSRHRTIVSRVELWRKANGNPRDMPEDVFVDIVRDVVLYGKRIDDVIIRGVFDVKPGKRGVTAEILSVSENMDIQKLGFEPEDIGELYHENTIMEVAQVALDKIEDAHDQVRAGATVASVVREIKNDIFDEPTLMFYIKPGRNICLSYTPAGDGDFMLPTKVYDVIFYENDKKVSPTDMPSDVIDYIERKLGVTIHD